MTEKDAEKVLRHVIEIETGLKTIIDVATKLDSDEERIALRKGVATVISEMYEQIERPIYREHPGITGRRDL